MLFSGLKNVFRSLCFTTFPFYFFFCTFFFLFAEEPLSCVERDKNDTVQRITLYGEENLNFFLFSETNCKNPSSSPLERAKRVKRTAYSRGAIRVAQLYREKYRYCKNVLKFSSIPVFLYIIVYIC
ncbi:predicted protein [Methanosarcina acetivorans C2A]|uniref:Uncharacterized protein n=1 Tax=Methanosarcina acetivorans (strain ATCC 35395 / DSM 2834 / JCM 12185 / C2A) TaxID=188937 RepID=Q8TR09_METAC|nr:predicted protein [Methanosarcina acetivorans C2A]